MKLHTQIVPSIESVSRCSSRAVFLFAINEVLFGMRLTRLAIPGFSNIPILGIVFFSLEVVNPSCYVHMLRRYIMIQSESIVIDVSHVWFVDNNYLASSSVSPSSSPISRFVHEEVLLTTGTVSLSLY